MFGRKRREREAAEAARAVEESDVDQRFHDDLRVRGELYASGKERTAVVTAVGETTRSAPGVTEITVSVDVSAGPVDRFPATLAMYVLASETAPVVGQSIGVVFDPNDRTQIRASPFWNSASLQGVNHVEDFSERYREHLRDAAQGERHGQLATAVVTGIETHDVIEPGLGMVQTEYAVEATVQPEHDGEFTATFALYTVLDGDTPPAVGQTIVVSFDPDDHSTIFPIAHWSAQASIDAVRNGRTSAGIQWRVPEKCPNCGARVDQATQSKADQPACPLCDAPLPCEPVG